MMFIVKNLQETAAGHLGCEILNGETWVSFVMAKSDEYEIHESSDWSDIKPCDQNEKDAHNAVLERDAIIAEIAALDLPSYVIERALAGDNEAVKKIKDNEEKKALIRARL